MSDDAELLLLQQRLATHITEFEQHKIEDGGRWDHLIRSQEVNTECIKQLTATVAAHMESTEGLITAYNAADGTVKVLSVIGKVGKWLTSIVIIGAAIKWCAEQL